MWVREAASLPRAFGIVDRARRDSIGVFSYSPPTVGSVPSPMPAHRRYSMIRARTWQAMREIEPDRSPDV
jgi:hypothetical protein